MHLKQASKETQQIDSCWDELEFWSFLMVNQFVLCLFAQHFLYFSCGDGIATVALTYSIEKQEQALIHPSGMSAKPNVK